MLLMKLSERLRSKILTVERYRGINLKIIKRENEFFIKKR